MRVLSQELFNSRPRNCELVVVQLVKVEGPVAGMKLVEQSSVEVAFPLIPFTLRIQCLGLKLVDRALDVESHFDVTLAFVNLCDLPKKLSTRAHVPTTALCVVVPLNDPSGELGRIRLSSPKPSRMAGSPNVHGLGSCIPNQVHFRAGVTVAKHGEHSFGKDSNGHVGRVDRRSHLDVVSEGYIGIVGVMLAQLQLALVTIPAGSNVDFDSSPLGGPGKKQLSIKLHARIQATGTNNRIDTSAGAIQRCDVVVSRADFGSLQGGQGLRG